LWNSLEIAKLIVAATTPIVALVFGFWISRSLKRLEEAQWVNQTVIEWKIRVYEDVMPGLNDLYCFFEYVGNWKELSPPQILELKRALDKRINTAIPVFAPELLASYDEFMNLCFHTFRGQARDAGLRTGFKNRQIHWADRWKPEWQALFAEDEEKTPRPELASAYSRLVTGLARELNLSLNVELSHNQRPALGSGNVQVHPH
jgi:hypothetical protein